MLINEEKKQHISILHAFYLETIDGICNTDFEKSRMKCYIKSYKKNFKAVIRKGDAFIDSGISEWTRNRFFPSSWRAAMSNHTSGKPLIR